MSQDFTKGAEGRGLNPARLLGGVLRYGNPALRGGFSGTETGMRFALMKARARGVQVLVRAAPVWGVEGAGVAEVGPL